MRVMIRGNWANYVGTDYCNVLGVYPDCTDPTTDKEVQRDAETYAWDCFEPDDDDYDGDEYCGEGPDYYVEEYDPSEDGHDMYRAGGGSFEDEFERLEAK